jgi:hypothetical protein
MTEQQVLDAITAALLSGRVKTVNYHMTRAIVDIKGGSTWKAAAAKHHVTESGISRAIKRIFG